MFIDFKSILQHLKFKNWKIGGFDFWCHEQGTTDSCHKSKIQKHMVTTLIWVRFFSSSWSTVLVLLLGSEGLIMLTFSTRENYRLIFSWKHGVSSSWNKIVETFPNLFESTKSRSEPRGELKFECRTKVCVLNWSFKLHQLLVTKESK